MQRIQVAAGAFTASGVAKRVDRSTDHARRRLGAQCQPALFAITT
jgi:hypothetical protein